MRLDHCAFRVKDRYKTAQFFIDALGYRIQQEFPIVFPDGTTANCIALEPPEKPKSEKFSWTWAGYDLAPRHSADGIEQVTYHLAPEIFISDGEPGSIVGNWVEQHGNSLHHIAYQVESVEATMKLWQEKGFAEFASDEPLKCPEDNLVQIFTKPSELTGIIYELIERGEHGFCVANVKELMMSTASD